MTCNDKDFLLFDGKYLYLKTINGRIKKKWEASSGMSGATVEDQNIENFGPLPQGEYIVHFDQTLSFKNNENLWDAAKWVVKSIKWGFVATPLIQTSGESFGRDSFYIHGGIPDGVTKGCIEISSFDMSMDSLDFPNADFHTFLRLYKRNFKLVVNYP